MPGYSRRFAFTKELLLNAIWDMAELQHGKITLDDNQNGKIGFRTNMYGIDYEYRFTVTENDTDCEVFIEMTESGSHTLITRAFSLLESMIQR